MQEVNHFQQSNSTVNEHTKSDVFALSMHLSQIVEIAAKAIGADLSRLQAVPVELGELYEDLANVFMNLSEQVRQKQR